jgi:hypothetical protein
LAFLAVQWRTVSGRSGGAPLGHQEAIDWGKIEAVDTRIYQAATDRENVTHEPQRNWNLAALGPCPKHLIAASGEDSVDDRRSANPHFGTFWSIRTILRKAMCASASMNLFEKNPIQRPSLLRREAIYRKREKLLACRSKTLGLQIIDWQIGNRFGVGGASQCSAHQIVSVPS